ncbi:hypothetical protein GIR22_07240 [Pseudomonas sp. CCM 7891]|uniref:Lipoprotein n=1 Tax=Pseudomonas karstica TaxID=1055468 RepID=A0A7X2UXY8_9PSED|nr:hypothetical protein [Pseudomonas karstica]MTD18943.1 hypothetical protein [Pseudomonas karstica]
MAKWKVLMGSALFVGGTLASSGCAVKAVDSFTLEVDLPANFRFRGDAIYEPARGEVCTLPERRGKRPDFKVLDTPGKPEANRVSFTVPLTERVNNCPLVLRSITFDMYAKWGERWSDVGGDYAFIGMRDRLESGMSGMPESGVQVLPGGCQWFFRTMGPLHAIRKLLKCNSLDAEGQPRTARAGGVVQRGALQGKTLRMVLGLTDEELPAFDDRWVAVSGGWKRCMGDSLDDVYAFCRGNTTDFKPFKMPDGRICNIYPTCKE